MSEEKREVATETETGPKETGRIEAFSDGVFAVAITLLAFNLKVPLVSDLVVLQEMVKEELSVMVRNHHAQAATPKSVAIKAT